jgi:hypothetical protein
VETVKTVVVVVVDRLRRRRSMSSSIVVVVDRRRRRRRRRGRRLGAQVFSNPLPRGASSYIDLVTTRSMYEDAWFLHRFGICLIAHVLQSSYSGGVLWGREAHWKGGGVD